MKVEIKSEKRGSKDYYDELLYVASKHNELLKDPTKKIYRMTKYISLLGIIGLCMLIMSILFFILDQSLIGVFLIALFIVYIFLFSISYIQYRKAINVYLNSEGSSVFVMDKNGVKVKRIINSSESRIELKWENIKYIIISKYSIYFLNDDKLAPGISVEIINKNKIIDGLKKLEKDELIVQNKYYSVD